MVDEKPWSEYSESDYSIAQWHNACLIHQHEGEPTSKSQCKLPVKTPSGTVNRNGVHAAAAALSGARGGVSASTEEKKSASGALARLYRQMDEDPPPSLLEHMDKSEALAHYGVPGMKWGIRRNRDSSAPRPEKSEDSAKAEVFKKQARSHGVSTLSNDQLKELNRRLELESKYDQWAKKNPTLKTKATKFVADLLMEEAKAQLGMGPKDKDGKPQKSDFSKVSDQLKQAFSSAKNKKSNSNTRSRSKQSGSKKRKTSRSTPAPVYRITSL